MGSLTPEQITTIMSALGPEQGAFIGGLYTRFANKHGVKAENEPSTGNDNTKNPSGPAK
jgi:hypothetical protein